MSLKYWIVTGGARGITFEIIKALNEKISSYSSKNNKFIIIGRTPPRVDFILLTRLHTDEKRLKHEIFSAYRNTYPDSSLADCVKHYEVVRHGLLTFENLETLRTLHVSFEYIALNIQDTRACLDFVRQFSTQQDGTEFALIHGAGISVEKNLSEKDLSAWKQIFDTKVKGLFNLLHAFAQAQISLDDVYLFGSIAAYIGGFGQSDYAAANSILSAFVHSSKHLLPNTRVLCFDFPAWDETGMSIRPHTKKFFKSIQFPYLSLSDGLRLTVDAMTSSSSPTELAIASKALFDAYAKAYTRPSLCAQSSLHLNHQASPPLINPPSLTLPLTGFSSVPKADIAMRNSYKTHTDSETNIVRHVVTFTPQDEIIRHHSLSSTGPLLAGAGYLALLFTHARTDYPNHLVTQVKNIRWKTPFHLSHAQTLTCTYQNISQTTLRFRFSNADGTCVYCDGTANITEGQPQAIPKSDFPTITTMHPIAIEDLYTKLQQSGYHHSGPFRCVKQMWQDSSAILSHLSSPEEDPFKRLTALFDGVAQTRGFIETNGLPAKVNAISFLKEDLGHDWYVYAPLASYRDQSPLTSLDLTIFNQKHDVIATYEQFKIYKTDKPLMGSDE